MAVTSEQNMTKVAEVTVTDLPNSQNIPKTVNVEVTESSLDDTLYSQTKVDHVREFGFLSVTGSTQRDVCSLDDVRRLESVISRPHASTSVR